MEQQPEYISIIIPTWNSGQWVRRTLDSVLKAADENCEIVLVDDCSTDNTLDILREYEERDSRILVFENSKHSGCSATRKYGVENCNGDAVMFVDSDDVLLPDAISELRAATTAESDIVVGNVSRRSINGKSRLVLSGHRREMTSAEYLQFLLSNFSDFMLHGKKFRRELFDFDNWDTDPLMQGIFHRALLMQLVCAATGTIVMVPGMLVYQYLRRPNSLSSMLRLRPEGVERLWMALEKLPLPRKEYVEWGLRLLDTTLLSRGLPIPPGFAPAKSMLAHAEGLDLSEEYQHLLRMLRSESYRLSVAQRNVREGNLTTEAPHLSIIICAYNNFVHLRRSIESVFDTGFRNIEILVVDDGSNWEESVKINGYCLKYPRIRLRKNTTHRGLSYSRRQAIAAAKGHVLLFINAGDTVVAAGLLEAVTLIDNGADICMMGARISQRYTGFDLTEFIPSEAARLQTGKDSFDALIEKVELPHSICFGMTRTTFTQGVDFDFPTDDYSCDTLWLISCYVNNPIQKTTDTIGYEQHNAPAKDLDADERCRCEIRLGLYTLDLLKHFGYDTPHYRAKVAEGVTTTFVRALAQMMQKPLFGRRRAAKFARQFLSANDVFAFYRTAGVDMPLAETCLAEARTFTDRK